MHRPRIENRIGYGAWLRCDHQQTELDSRTESVRLAETESADVVGSRPELRVPWQLLQGGVLVARCDGACDDAEQVIYLSPQGPVDQVHGPDPAIPAPGVFVPPAPRPLGRVVGVSRGSRGLAWVVFAAGSTRMVAVLDPATTRRRARWTIDGCLAAVGTHAGAVAASEYHWWRQTNGRWTPLEIEADSGRVLAMAAVGSRAFALLREDGGLGPQLAVIDPDSSTVLDIPGLETPLHLVADPDGVWISEIEAPPPSRTAFYRFEVRDEGLVRTRTAIARDFDGRGAWWSNHDQVRATRGGVGSTASGALGRSRVSRVHRGTVELPAFDSGRLQTPWHRLYVDVCLPAGTSVRVSARGGDEPFDPPRIATLPANVSGTPTPVPDAPTLGSRHPDDIDGWREQPVPSVEPFHVDRPLADGRIPARPLLDSVPRGPARGRPEQMVTLEVLLDTDPGRFLWVRLHLTGTGRLTPAIHAVRATHARPSLLAHLPDWWSRDPDSARAIDRVLSLFEGEYTERQALITALPALFDARATPSEALDWLSGFLAIERDAAFDESQRRQLLLDMPELYRRRGTPWAMERLAHIVTGAPARVVEHFRLRGGRAAVVDGTRRLGASVLGATLHLGSSEPDGPGAFETAIIAARPRLQERRDATGCPARLPPLPVATPAARWARRTAHRFTVVVFRGCDAETEALLDRTIEAAKPAHTVHELCWADSGLRLDVNARVGLGTQLFDSPEPARDVGRAVLSSHTPLAGSPPAGTIVGQSQVGRTTHDGPAKETP